MLNIKMYTIDNLPISGIELIEKAKKLNNNILNVHALTVSTAMNILRENGYDIHINPKYHQRIRGS